MPRVTSKNVVCGVRWRHSTPKPRGVPRPSSLTASIKTTDSTAATYLGLAGNLVDNPGAERFFDLSGWKDAAGTAEPTVTATSKNTYSDRDAVAALYDTDPTLKASKFWYEAELFDNARLRRLLSAGTPDLVKVLDSPELKGSALLCYYFFFPAHEEALATCTNVEAKEFGSFAGEWACMALLLGQDGADKPSFIGQTGRLLSPIPGVSLPPQTDDGQDAARRIVMKVNKFADAASIDGHPTLFVADGTHSLYLQAGTIAVTYPADSRPYSCGRAEAPPPPSEPSPSQHGGAIFYAKLLAAIQFAAVLRVPVAVALILLEGAKPYGGVDVVGTVSAGDDAMPDVTGQPGSNQFLRPQSVPVAECDRRRHGAWHLAVDSCRTGEAGLVARRLPRIGLSGPVGTAGRERPLRQAGRHEIPGLLENVLPRLCYR